MEQSLSEVSLTIVALFPRAMISHFYQDKLQGTSMYAMPTIILEAALPASNLMQHRIWRLPLGRRRCAEREGV